MAAVMVACKSCVGVIAGVGATVAVGLEVAVGKALVVALIAATTVSTTWGVGGGPIGASVLASLHAVRDISITTSAHIGATFPNHPIGKTPCGLTYIIAIQDGRLIDLDDDRSATPQLRQNRSTYGTISLPHDLHKRGTLVAPASGTPTALVLKAAVAGTV